MYTECWWGNLLEDREEDGRRTFIPIIRRLGCEGGRWSPRSVGAVVLAVLSLWVACHSVSNILFWKYLKKSDSCESQEEMTF